MSGRTGKTNATSGARAGWVVVRTVIALVLLAAAGLKTHQLATEPVSGSSILDSRGLLIAVVEFEWLFGLWLLAGLYSVATWRATVCLFVLFAGVSFYKAASGAASCGCFGTVEINPWYTVGLDLSILGGLLWRRPTESQSGDGITVSTVDLRIRLAGVLLAWLCLGIGSGAAMASYRTTRLGHVGELLADGRTVVLEPETWVGKRFPLLDWIETEDDLAEGEWIVVMYRHDCPHCHSLLTKRRIAVGSLSDESARVALIEFPPHKGHQAVVTHSYRRAHFGRLNDGLTWFAGTPICVAIRGGVVETVRTD